MRLDTAQAVRQLISGDGTVTGAERDFWEGQLVRRRPWEQARAVPCPEVARRCGVTNGMVRNYSNAGLLQPINPAKRAMGYTEESVDAFLQGLHRVRASGPLFVRAERALRWALRAVRDGDYVRALGLLQEASGLLAEGGVKGGAEGTR